MWFPAWWNSILVLFVPLTYVIMVKILFITNPQFTAYSIQHWISVGENTVQHSTRELILHLFGGVEFKHTFEFRQLNRSRQRSETFAKTESQFRVNRRQAKSWWERTSVISANVELSSWKCCRNARLARQEKEFKSPERELKVYWIALCNESGWAHSGRPYVQDAYNVLDFGNAMRRVSRVSFTVINHFGVQYRLTYWHDMASVAAKRKEVFALNMHRIIHHTRRKLKKMPSGEVTRAITWVTTLSVIAFAREKNEKNTYSRVMWWRFIRKKLRLQGTRRKNARRI